MRRLGSLQIVLALAAIAAMPAAVMAGPIPGLPGVPGAPPAPGPSPAAPSAPAPGTLDSTYVPPPGASPTQPWAYGGPSGRVRLGGTWSYRADPRGGSTRGWPRGRFQGRNVSVPYVPNAWPVTGARGARNFEGGAGWYVKRFRVAKTGRYAIRFESVHHKAVVWVDGKRVARHTGAYMPFEARPLLSARREHVLVVRADWRDPLQMKRTGWHRGWFNFGGLNREVTIRPLGQVELANPVIRTQLRGDGAALVTVAARVLNHGAARTVAVQGRLQRGGQAVPFAFRPARVGSHRTRTVRTTVVVKDPELWSTANPQLYELTLGAGSGAGWQALVGLRELSWAHGRLAVNGRPLTLYGASIHEDAKGRGDGLTPADMDAIVTRLKRIGANATRALHPLSPPLLERLDRAGILVWQQVGPFDSPGNWVAQTPALRRSATRRVRTAVADGQTHPSILTWAVANEVAGNGHSGGQAAWVDSTARGLRRSDPSRPIAIDIWGTHIPSRPGRMYRHINLIGVTSYIGWYEFPMRSRSAKARLMRGRVSRLHRVFPGKSLFVTEFGAEANGRNARGAHGGYAYQANLIALHLSTYESLPEIDGMLIWNLSDFALTPTFGGGSIGQKVHGIHLLRGLNQKGLFDYSGRAKPAAIRALTASAAVRAANAAAQ